MDCYNNSNVLEFDFTMGQFLKDFFIPSRETPLWTQSPYINYIKTTFPIDDENNLYLTYKEYSPPILEINYPNGNFDDEYKYIYIQCPKITNLLQNCFTNRIVGTNTYVRYYQQNAPDFVSPVFKIADNNETENNVYDFNNNNNKVSILSKYDFLDNGKQPFNPFQVITPTLQNLKQNISVTTNKNYYLPYNIRNKNKLFLQLDLNYNDFALLLHSISLSGSEIIIFHDSFISYADMYNSPYMIRNFQFTKTSLTEFNIWLNSQSQQINIGEILDIPIQLFISKEVL